MSSRLRFRPVPRIAIIGSGFAGLGMGIRLRQAGIEDFAILERADSIGGTWRDNSYPGCAVDVQSHLYSYSFAPNPDWSRVYAPQEEIWSYIRRCADEFGVGDHVRFGHEVLGADWDETRQRWLIETSAGPVEAQFLISAMGPLSDRSLPDIPGLDTFEGARFHSAAWDHDYDLAGKRVAVIGTGASAAQLVPEIQPKVAKLLVFQRTPPWTFPRRARMFTFDPRTPPPRRSPVVLRRSDPWRGCPIAGSPDRGRRPTGSSARVEGHHGRPRGHLVTASLVPGPHCCPAEAPYTPHGSSRARTVGGWP